MTTLAFFIFDPMYLILVALPGLVIGGIAQAKLRSAYSKGAKVRSNSGISGAQAAQEIMRSAGVSGVRIEQVQGFLSDHYDPRHRVLRLSPEVYRGSSMASLGVAAHEAGHALQHAKGYTPLTIRNALVPAAGIGSNLAFILVIAGLFLQMGGLAWAGVLLFSAVVLFQLVNLPVEFDASKRARQQLLDLGIVTSSEEQVAGKVLNAAALTYVAATVTAALQLLYFVMLAMSASRD